MPRPLRPDIEGAWHHVMNRGIDHGVVFFSDNDRIEFGQRLADIHQRFGVRIHAYCLMDTHYHLLVQCPDGGLSESMQRLGSLYTRHVNDRLGRDGALFRGRFHSRLIVDDAHLIAAVRYIHRNALDLPGVDRAIEYRWSSHRTYLGLRRRPDWLSTDVVLGGATADEFNRFVEAPLHGRPSAFGIDDLVHTIELVLAERGRHPDRRVGAMARQLALVWSLDTALLGEEVVMRAFGFEVSGTFRTAVSRARRVVRETPAMVDVLERAVSLLWPGALHRGSDPGCNQRAARAAS